jgi:hypothetical protein
MARNFHTNFLEQLQGGTYHQTPKTMAIVDTQAFLVFLGAWEALSSEFNLRLASDADFVTFLRRARSSSLAFNGGYPEESTSPSALDIGSFMSSFKTFCAPDADSDLTSLLEDADSAYTGMFVEQGVGQGTPPATGMHINWPTRRVYEALLEQDPAYPDELFDTTGFYATANAPNWLEFLESYYASNVPPVNQDGSVCTLRTSTLVEPENETDLLVNPIVTITSDGVEVSTEITRSTDEVIVYYGTDMTPLLEQLERRLKRRMLESVGSKKSSAIHSESMNHYHPIEARAQRKSSRRMQDLGEDYFIVFGGEIHGEYAESRYTAIWDRNFYFLSGDNVAESIYTYDIGGGLKDVPVFYFSNSNPVTSEDISLSTTMEDAILLGGQFGVLSFTPDTTSSTVSTFDLYTYGDGATISETPRSAGGYIVPIVFTEIFIGDVFIAELVGGFNSTIFAWNEESVFGMEIVGAREWLKDLELDVVIDIVAYDDDTFNSDTFEGFDSLSFYLSYDDLASDTPTAPTDTGDTPNAAPAPSGDDTATTSSTTALSMMSFLLVVFGWSL